MPPNSPSRFSRLSRSALSARGGLDARLTAASEARSTAAPEAVRDALRDAATGAVHDASLQHSLSAVHPSAHEQSWPAALAPLAELLDDPTVEEIWCNQPDLVFASRGGEAFLTGAVLTCESLTRLVSAVLSPSGRRLDALSPWVDSTLGDGSRVHIVAPQVARGHYALNIRKFPPNPFSIDDLVGLGMLTRAHADLLVQQVTAGASVLVSGPTNSGKTTLLRALSHSLDPQRRVITCEEVYELSLRNRDVAAMQTRPPGVERNGEVTLRDLVVQALRMRPDVLVIGEVRQAEAFDLLIALNCGVPALCSIHANDAASAVTKLLTLASLAGPQVSPAFAELSVRSGLDLVVHLERHRGRRRVAEVSHVAEMAAVARPVTLDLSKKVA